MQVHRSCGEPGVLELSCSWDGTDKATPVWTDSSVFWSPSGKQPWLKDLLQSLPAGGLANYVPGCSLAMRADAVIEFVPTLPFVPSPLVHQSVSHGTSRVLFREAESQPCPQPEDMWLVSLIYCGKACLQTKMLFPSLRY